MLLTGEKKDDDEKTNPYGTPSVRSTISIPPWWRNLVCVVVYNKVEERTPPWFAFHDDETKSKSRCVECFFS